MSVIPFRGTVRIQRGDSVYRLVGYSTSPRHEEEADKFADGIRAGGRDAIVEGQGVQGIKSLVGEQQFDDREEKAAPLFIAGTPITFGSLIYVLEGTVSKRVARVVKGIQKGAKKARKARRKESGTTSLRSMRG